MKRFILLLILLISSGISVAAYHQGGSCDTNADCLIPFPAFDATDYVTPETAMSTISTCYYSKDGGAVALCNATTLPTILTNCQTAFTYTRYCANDTTNAQGGYMFAVADSNEDTSGGLDTSSEGMYQVWITSSAAAQVYLQFWVSSATISGMPAAVLDTSLSGHRTEGTVGGQLGKIH